MSLVCVVHYDGLTSGTVVPLSANAHQKLLEAKNVRVNERVVSNQHLEQCGSIPITINEKINGMHWACYKTFTHILSKKRATLDEKNETFRKRTRVSQYEPTITRSVSQKREQSFPTFCFLCKKHRKKVNADKYEYSHKLISPDSGVRIVNAARLKNDYEMLKHIEYEDLVKREFCIHDSCRRNYTRDTKDAEKCQTKKYACEANNTFKKTSIKLRSGLELKIETNEQEEHAVETNEHEEHEVEFSVNAADEKDDEPTSTFNMEAVKNEILTTVFGKKETLSMRKVHEIYNDKHLEDSRYRSKLKNKIKEIYGDQITFLKHTDNTPDDIVINYGSSEHLKQFDKKNIIKTASKFIRDDILEYANEYKRARELNEGDWPPNLTVLRSLFESIPESVVQFLETLLKDHEFKNEKSDRIERLIRSYSCDLIHGVTVGKVLTLKHYLVGLGLHNMGGQKLLIQILNLLGHSISYDTVMMAETALAELSQMQSETGSSSGLIPKSNDDLVFTYFWADNFNKKVESKLTSMIDSTHMIKFQEKSDSSTYQKIQYQKLDKIKSKFHLRKLPEVSDLMVNKKISPKPFKRCDTELLRSDVDVSVYIFWIILRELTQSEKLLPNFSGWRLSVRKVNQVAAKETVITYLPPINSSVNDFSTIYQYLSYMQKMCFEVNMPYVNVTLDCGAAMNAFKLIWNYPTVFDDVIIHLGDFHFMKEIFTVLGTLVKASGFEDVVFLSNLSSSGSLNGILNGSHYNRCWNVHQHYAEALERLCFLRFLQESSKTININDTLMDACEGNDSNLLRDPAMLEIARLYSEFKKKAREGSLGKTPQFWVVNYLDIIQILHMFHIGVQEGDYNARLIGYAAMMPYFFGLNLMNYARYGSYYVYQMLNMEELYPGNKELLTAYGISVQGQDKYPLRTSIDQRGEQTLNRDAKMAGGITGFAVDESSVSRWTLNRSSVAEITNELKKFAGTGCSDSVYKAIRPTEIVRSNELTSAVINVLENDYLNPFDEELDTNKLYNLSSGIPVDDLIADGILKIFGNGEINYNKFIKERLTSDEIGFFEKLPKLKIKLFSQTGKQVQVVVNGKMKTIQANSNIISKLLALSTKLNRKIDMKVALCFPLCFTPMNLAHSDGARRQTDKSELAKILLEARTQETSYPRKENVIAYLVDLMAMIRARPNTPATFNDLVLVIVDMIPSGYKRIDIIADTYRQNSIKDPERIGRGCSEKILVKSSSTHLPRNFDDFLDNGDNKTRLIEIFLDVLKTEREYIFSNLKCDILYYSMDNECHVFTRDGMEQCQMLSSNQEEADTKLILHCAHALNSVNDGSVILRSHSGDTDINVIASSLIIDQARRTFIDYNTGVNRKVLCLGDLDMNEVEKRALIGLHSFTGNDYVSSFFRKAKKTCWKTLQKNLRFYEVFAELGSTWEPSDELVSKLEEFVCLLFGSRRIKKVNDLRHLLYSKKFEKKEKVIDLSLLPPCLDSLKLHIRRSCYVARRWRLSKQSMFDEPSFSHHGWEEDGQIDWVKKAFPNEIEMILVEDINEEVPEDNGEINQLEYLEPGDESEGSDDEQ